jgi:hypothetical protein
MFSPLPERQNRYNSDVKESHSLTLQITEIFRLSIKLSSDSIHEENLLLQLIIWQKSYVLYEVRDLQQLKCKNKSVDDVRIT